MSITPTTTTTPPSTSDSPKLGSLLPDRAQVLDRGFVYLIDEPNSDLKVVNAARISFGKQSKVLSEQDKRLISYLATHNHWTPFAHCRFNYLLDLTDDVIDFITQIQEEGTKWEISRRHSLLRFSTSLWTAARFHLPVPAYLTDVAYIAVREAASLKSLFKVSMLRTDGQPLSWESWSEEQPVTLHIKMPVFVARQWMKSNHGIVYNEISRRYVDDAPEFHVPERWRKRPEKSIKQGSSDEEVVDTLGIREVPAHYHFAETCYNHLLQDEVAPEQARIVLPVAHYTEVWMTCSLRALARVLKLRLHPHAQREIQQYAKAVRAVVEPRYPTLTELMKEFDDEREDVGTAQPQGDGGVPVKADGGQVQREQGGGD
jgi:thymidylate synthase (FAD)